MKLRSGAFRWLVVMSLGSVSVGCADDMVLQHGVFNLEFDRAASEAESPYTGTEIVRATWNYDACLRGFYDANPNYSATGVDGESVFGGYDLGGEGWKDRLCDDPEEGVAECEVLEFRQSLTSGASLTVEYRVLQERLENWKLPFGPLPVEALAGCTPVVSRPGTRQDVVGTDDGENQIWETSSLNPAMATTGQGGEIVINATRLVD